MVIEVFIFLTLFYIAYLMEHLSNNIYLMMDGVGLIPGAINNLKKDTGWNVLTEDTEGVIHGLPGDDGQYLMTDGKDIWIDDYVDGVDDGISLDSGRDIREIKAWMYMPELPKTDRR